MITRTMGIRRALFGANLCVGLAISPATVLAETVAAPSNATMEVSLGERIAKLEERVDTQRRDAQSMQTDLAETKKQHEELLRTTVIAGGIFAFVVAALAVLLGKVKSRIDNHGPKAIVDTVIEKLYAEDAAKFTRLFEQHRNELVRVIMARDQPIAFLGTHEDSDQIKEALKSIGYERFVDSPAKAKVAIVFCKPDTFPQHAQELSNDVKARRIPKRLVLYSAGGAHLKPDAVRELNTWAMAVAANMPTTAATQTATLAALAQPVM